MRSTHTSRTRPESGHYCFVGLVGNEQDPAPNPTDFNDFDTYRLYIRNNNNVTWRNFNVESNEPNEGDFRAMNFLAPGANDRTRRFCLEVLTKLPRGSRLQVEAPLALLQAMQAVSPWTIVEGDKGRVPINPHGRHRLGCAYFPRSMPSRFGCSSTSRKNSASTDTMLPSANCMKPRKSAA